MRFSYVVSGIGNTCNVNKLNRSTFFLILNGKILDMNVLNTFCRDLRINNHDGRRIIFIVIDWNMIKLPHSHFDRMC